jgi:hypothetical protein
VRPYLFGAGLQGPRETGQDAVKRVLESLRGDEERTALADAIHEVLARKEGDLPAAIVVMTDGLDTASKFRLEEVAEKCRDLGVPLHIYGVGTPDAGSLQRPLAGERLQDGHGRNRLARPRRQGAARRPPVAGPRRR